MPRVARKRAAAPSIISKSVLADEINRIIRERGLTQTEAAYLLKDAPSQLSLIATGKLKGFSTERLMRLLTGLGRDVEIRIRRAQGKTGKVKISVK
jgi:predicted XRE-type DNA-binding protein